jgi:hypothetical protein
MMGDGVKGNNTAAHIYESIMNLLHWLPHNAKLNDRRRAVEFLDTCSIHLTNLANENSKNF